MESDTHFERGFRLTLFFSHFLRTHLRSLPRTLFRFLTLYLLLLVLLDKMKSLSDQRNIRDLLYVLFSMLNDEDAQVVSLHHSSNAELLTSPIGRRRPRRKHTKHSSEGLGWQRLLKFGERKSGKTLPRSHTSARTFGESGFAARGSLRSRECLEIATMLRGQLPSSVLAPSFKADKDQYFNLRSYHWQCEERSSFLYAVLEIEWC